MRNPARMIFALLLAVALWPAVPVMTQNRAKGLHIYLIDVEGGSSILFVAPSGESLLIDTGIPDEQEVKRIADLATNIAEDVIYMCEGRIIRHSKADG